MNTLHRIALTTALVLTPLTAQAGIQKVDAMSSAHSVVDFDALPLGPVSVADINARFPQARLRALSFDLKPTTGTYNFNENGRALAPDPTSGELSIVAPGGGQFRAANYLDVDLAGPSSEFGFIIGDWGGPTYARFYLDGVGVGEELEFEGTTDFNYFRATQDDRFDRVRLRALDFEGPNWVIPALAVQHVSEPGTLPLLGLAGVLAMGGRGGARPVLRR